MLALIKRRAVAYQYAKGKTVCLVILGAMTIALMVSMLWSSVFSLSLIVSNIQQYAHHALLYTQQYPLFSGVIFFCAYAFICSFPFPFVSLVTVLAGYLFGFFYGVLLVSFASALGCCILFLMSRYFFRDFFSQIIRRYLVPRLSLKYRALLPLVNHDDKQQTMTGIAMALSLRLIPGMPFSFPSMLLGLGALRLWAFYVSTQLGLLLTLMIYVNAGVALAGIPLDNANNTHQWGVWSHVFSVDIVIAMLLLAVIPIVGSRCYAYFSSR